MLMECCAQGDTSLLKLSSEPKGNLNLWKIYLYIICKFTTGCVVCNPKLTLVKSWFSPSLKYFLLKNSVQVGVRINPPRLSR